MSQAELREKAVNTAAAISQVRICGKQEISVAFICHRRSPFKILRHLVLLLAIRGKIANAGMKFITPLFNCTGRNGPDGIFQFPTSRSVHAPLPISWVIHGAVANILERS
jgi:hypothetical protein